MLEKRGMRFASLGLLYETKKQIIVKYTLSLGKPTQKNRLLPRQAASKN